MCFHWSYWELLCYRKPVWGTAWSTSCPSKMCGGYQAASLHTIFFTKGEVWSRWNRSRKLLKWFPNSYFGKVSVLISFRNCYFWSFKRQSNKMVKHTQTIRRQIADAFFEYVWPFCEIDAKKIKIIASKYSLFKRRQWCHSGIFIVNFEHISSLFLVFLLLTLNK